MHETFAKLESYKEHNSFL